MLYLASPASNSIHTAAFNQHNAPQREHVYIALINDTENTLSINPEPAIPSTRRDFLQMPAGTTIQNILSRIDIGERTFQIMPPITLDTIKILFAKARSG